MISEGIFINGEKVTFNPENILNGDISSYTEAIGEATQDWLDEHLEPGGSVPIDDTLSISGAAADAKAAGDAITELNTQLSEYFGGSSNLFALEDKASEYYHGLTVKIENGVITLSCTTLASAVYLKLTNGHVFGQSEPTSWQSETVDFFEVGKTYSIGYKVVSGEMPSTIGTPFRHAKVSTLSATVPTATITAENFPQYCQLYVPKATTNLSVSFIPFVVEGYVSDYHEKSLESDVYVASKAIPEKEFNYFTVSVNPYIPNSTSDATTNQDNESNLVDTQCVVTFPRSYTADGKPTPIIMYGHGRTDTVSVGDWVENNTDRLALVRAFTSAGYAVFDVDSTNHTNNVDVGCPQLMEGYRKAFEYIKETYNVEDRFCIYSYSFGTFPALNMLAWNPSLVKTACLSAVRASIKAVFDRGAPFNAEIAQKFGFADTTGATYEADKLLGYDMYADMVDIDGTDRIFVKIPPIKVLTSDADTLELTQAHTFISALKNGGNSVTYREVSGLSHLEMCLLDAGGLKEEVIMWFNRFK